MTAIEMLSVMMSIVALVVVVSISSVSVVLLEPPDPLSDEVIHEGGESVVGEVSGRGET
jgi:hypothetical protein